MPKRPSKTARKPEDLTTEELYECLAEGQARVMDYFHTMLNIGHEAKLKGEPGRLKAIEVNQDALMKLLNWAMHRDDVKKKPHPLEAVWAFRQRAYDVQREKAIESLEGAIASLKAQRPLNNESPPTKQSSGISANLRPEKPKA